MINLATFSLSLEYYHMHDIGNSLFPEYWLALLTSQIFSITSGFYLFLNFVFITSSLKTSHQFLRFLVTNLFALLFSMLNLKIMIDYFNWDTNIAYLISVVIVQTANYFVQLNFSFKR
ncbi:GtrA family protein [Pedobacter sp. GR22-6]|uniref:GtrA family protein n=1 Tax=Pedobacter sp. GR22-6 TaxID=3127957 RepID=UPI003FCE3864